MEHRSDSWLSGVLLVLGFGTLLGPEETSCGVFFLAVSVAGHLTLTVCVVRVWVVVSGVVGCGCLLSVA